jgi:hypothetical protein
MSGNGRGLPMASYSTVSLEFSPDPQCVSEPLAAPGSRCHREPGATPCACRRVRPILRAVDSRRRPLVSIAAALILGVAVGCGGVRTDSPGQEGGERTSSVSALDDGSLVETVEGRQSATAAVDEMAVFSGPRTEADVLPGKLAYRLEPMGCTRWESVNLGGCLGEPLAGESRLLLSGLGVGNTSLYAWPTTEGGVCFAWDEGAGGCQRHFPRGEHRATFMGIDPDDEGVGAPGTLVGIVPDDVVAVGVVVRGVRHSAVLERNGLFYELPDGSCTNWAFEQLVVNYRDGTSYTVPIKWHHGSSTLPETCRA